MVKREIFHPQDHVGICLRLANNDLRVFDSNIDTGVSLCEWRNFIHENDLYKKYQFLLSTYLKCGLSKAFVG
jgi:hypothetical protein